MFSTISVRAALDGRRGSMTRSSAPSPDKGKRRASRALSWPAMERRASCTTSDGFEKIRKASIAGWRAADWSRSRSGFIAIDERRRAAIVKVEQAQARRNAASKEIGEAKKAQDEARAQGLMAEVGELKDAIPTLEADEKAVSEGARRRARRKFPTCRSTMCRTVSTSTVTSSTTGSARSPNSRSRRGSISSWARRSARWISRPPRSCPARVSWS